MASSQPSSNLYISGLPPHTIEETFREVFGQYATVLNCKVLTGGTTALLDLESPEVATKLIELLNGNIPQGLPAPIQLKYANPKGVGKDSGKGMVKGYGAVPMDKGGWGKGGGGKPYGAGEPSPKDNLYIIGMPGGVDESGIQQILGQYGNILSVKVLGIQNGNTAAMVRFATVEEATLVKDNLNGNIPQGWDRPITVRYSNDSTPFNVSPTPKGSWQQSGKGGGGGAWQNSGNAWQNAGKGEQDQMDMLFIIQQVEGTGALPGADGSTQKVSISITGLPPSCREYHLYRIFCPFGPIGPNGVKVAANPDGTGQGVGFVDYLNANSAHNAVLVLNGAVLPDGTSLRVQKK